MSYSYVCILKETEWTKRENMLRETLSAFFDAILNTKCAYKVFVGRECSILLSIVKSHNELAARDDIMTDVGFLMRAEEIIDYYKNYKAFPTIILADESLSYGRALNTILVGWEQVLLKLARRHGLILSIEEIRVLLSEALCIKIFVQKQDRISLLPAYQRCLQYTWCLNSNENYEKFTAYLTRILQTSDKVNAVYTASCNLRPTQVYAVQKALLKNQYIQVQPQPVINLEMHKKFFKSYNVYLRYLPDRIAPKAISIVRLFERNSNIWLIPYVYFSDFTSEKFDYFVENLDMTFALRFGEKKIRELHDLGRAQSELVATIVNYKLLQSILNEADLSANEVDFEFEQVAWSLGGSAQSARFLETLCNQPASGMSVLHQWIAQMAEEADHPFGQFHRATPVDTTFSAHAMRNLVRSLIYKRGIDAECAAFHALNGGLTQKMMAQGNKMLTLSVVLSKIKEQAEQWDYSEYELNIDCVLAQLMLMMDQGYIATITYDVNTAEHCKIVSHFMRVSEHSLSIFPTLYVQYIPLLIEMENQCLYSWQEMKIELEQYVGTDRAKPRLAENLWYLTQSIHETGRDMNSLEWYAQEAGVDLGKKNAHVRAYRQWLFDY